MRRSPPEAPGGQPWTMAPKKNFHFSRPGVAGAGRGTPKAALGNGGPEPSREEIARPPQKNFRTYRKHRQKWIAQCVAGVASRRRLKAGLQPPRRAAALQVRRTQPNFPGVPGKAPERSCNFTYTGVRRGRGIPPYCSLASPLPEIFKFPAHGHGGKVMRSPPACDRGGRARTTAPCICRARLT